jgi:hypothetical protein
VTRSVEELECSWCGPGECICPDGSKPAPRKSSRNFEFGEFTVSFNEMLSARCDLLELAINEIANTPADCSNFVERVKKIAVDVSRDHVPTTTERPALQGAREYLRWALKVIVDEIATKQPTLYEAEYAETTTRAYKAMDCAYAAQVKVDAVRKFLEEIDDCGEPYVERDAALEAIRHV